MASESPHPAASLNLSAVKKAFGDTTVLHSIDLSVAAGEFVVFIGPSGCGKSTLLRLISGLDGLTDGQIAIDGVDVTATQPSKRGVAMVFQSYALYPHMTVSGNMGFALRKARMAKAEIAKKVARAAKILNIEELLDRRPAELSGGQRQRVAIGRAIVRDPCIFLFDEPLSNLDSELRMQMRLEIARLHRELGTTMIFVTHDQIEAMTLANRIVVLRDGMIEQVGAPLELYDDPDNSFVAGFLGAPRMNFLAARIVENSTSGTVLALDDFDHAPFTMLLSSQMDFGQTCTIGVRPEQLGPNRQVPLAVNVDAVESLGGLAYAYATGPRGASLTISLGTDRTVAQGDTLDWGFRPNDAFVFDANGHRVR